MPISKIMADRPCHLSCDIFLPLEMEVSFHYMGGKYLLLKN